MIKLASCNPFFAERERDRLQGVFEGVVRNQIRSRVSELCGSFRSVNTKNTTS